MRPYFVLSGLLDENLGPAIIGYDARHFYELKRFWRERKAEEYALSKDWAFSRGRALFGEMIHSTDIAPENSILVAQYFGLYDQPWNPVRSYAVISLSPGADIAHHIEILQSHRLPADCKFKRAFVGVDRTSSIVERIEKERSRER